MVIKYPCPKCGKESAIRYGKVKLRSNVEAQRVLCLACHKTSSLRHPFFYKSKGTENDINEAIAGYIKNESLRTIAKRLHTHPNTVFYWVMAVFRDPIMYKDYLKKQLGFNERAAMKFFSDLRRASRVRITRAPGDFLAKSLEPIFDYLNQTGSFSCRERYGRPIRRRSKRKKSSLYSFK